MFRSGFARSIPAARQIISHGHIQVNSKRVDIASYRVRVGDVIGPKPKSRGYCHTRSNYKLKVDST